MSNEEIAYVIGIDAGTTSIKGILMNNQGEIVGSAKEEYMLDTGADDTCELDAEVYWNVTCRIIRTLISKSGINPENVFGVSFSSQGETFIPVDVQGNPLRKAIVWLDNRSEKEARQIREKFGPETIMKMTGQPEVVPTWPATKILWLKKHEHQLFKQVYKYLLVEDFLIFRMTGKFCSEPSVASSTLYLDIREKKWWKEMLDFIGISENQLPQLHRSGTPVGNLTKEAAVDTGLRTDTLCVTGSYDHPAGAIGSGNISKGDVTLTIGASMAMCVALDKPIADLTLKIPCQCHAIDGLYFLQPYAQTAGMVLKWFKDEFCAEEIEKARQNQQDPYDLMIWQAANVQPGADGLIMLPHLMGTGSPEFNPKATGVFAGIRMGMGKGHFIRAIIESVSLMIQHNLEFMKKKGIAVNVIHALGGASGSNLWNQVLADVTGLPVVTLRQTENASIGACLLAGTGTGIFKDLKTACQTSIKTQSMYKPNMSNHQLYKKMYYRYQLLYESLENYWK
jgi:xylulokinase